MSLAILALLACLVLIVFAIVPKGLTLTEMIFLYFIIGISTITLFTILDVNLQWVPLTRSVEGSFAMYICRFIVIPFQILLSVCVFHSNWQAKWRWGGAATILVFLCLEDQIYLWTGILTFHKWNEFYSALMYVVFMLVVWWVARWFIGLDKGESQNNE
ncbi:hypothetical protein [Niallia sp. FSL W8-0635]|uniref:hypothetical protein n=1 Tax=Niallia sp. FSL W8-0635 TaxID=2975337 RepID=UPI0009C70FAD|nr:Uncharacterised protein [Mycobacteroides abscessus subsp. abscessus]HEO8421985.1 hypothetical protein [Yersinia enterocolitica]